MSTVVTLLENNLTAVVLAICAAIGFFLGSKANRKRQVALATYHAFHIVEDLAGELGPGRAVGLDKALQGLKAADEYMRANGWRPLKEGEKDVAKLTFKSMNAQADAAVAVVAGAISPPLPVPGK